MLIVGTNFTIVNQPEWDKLLVEEWIKGGREVRRKFILPTKVLAEFLCDKADEADKTGGRSHG